MFWVVVAALADTFRADIFGWVIISSTLATGVLLFAVGVSMTRGRYPTSRGWLVWSAVILAPFALLLFQDDHGAPEVNTTVERAYMVRSDVQRANADCSYVEKNKDGSEWWVCDMETPLDYDTCNVDVTKSQAASAKVMITYCLNDDLGS
jgi:hypothetical protein